MENLKGILKQGCHKGQCYHQSYNVCILQTSVFQNTISQHSKRMIVRWLRMLYSTEKSQFISFPFNNSPKSVPSTPFLYDNNEIQLSSTIKCLGIYLYNKISLVIILIILALKPSMLDKHCTAFSTINQN